MNVAIYGADTGPQPDAPQEGFAKLKGHLPFPIAGRAQARKVPKTSTQTAAIDLLAPDGSVARSVAPAALTTASSSADFVAPFGPSTITRRGYTPGRA